MDSAATRERRRQGAKAGWLKRHATEQEIREEEAPSAAGCLERLRGKIAELKQLAALMETGQQEKGRDNFMTWIVIGIGWILCGMKAYRMYRVDWIRTFGTWTQDIRNLTLLLSCLGPLAVIAAFGCTGDSKREVKW